MLYGNCSGMLNFFVYVVWIDSDGNGYIGIYWIIDKDVNGIYLIVEEFFNKKCERINGVIIFEFSRFL